jgi:predicted nucleotidyltransferase
MTSSAAPPSPIPVSARSGMSASDESFLFETAGRLAGLPNVDAVTLGGSRTQGTQRPDSDWDFAVYYRGEFDPDELRAIGWPGYVSAVGEWGGVFNGGAWLTIDGRRSDIHYRDMAVVERVLDDALAGRFTIEPLMFHLAGIPTYLVLAELALSRVLFGEVPEPAYPGALRRSAPRRWWDRATRTFGYAIDAHAAAGRVTEFAGLTGQAVAQSAHAVLAARGVWTTNDKALVTRAGLRGIDPLLADLSPNPGALSNAGRAIRALCEAAVDAATDPRSGS